MAKQSFHPESNFHQQYFAGTISKYRQKFTNNATQNLDFAEAFRIIFLRNRSR
jgi:hypothetical protein